MEPNRIALHTIMRKMRSNQLLLLLQFAKEACLALGLSNEIGRIDWHDISKALNLCGGYTHQTSTKIQVILDSGDTMDALYCPWSCLPILQMFGTQPAHSIWDNSLHFTEDDT